MSAQINAKKKRAAKKWALSEVGIRESWPPTKTEYIPHHYGSSQK